MRIVLALAMLTLALPALSFAQPEDRRRTPTGGPATTEQCSDVASERLRAAQGTAPGFDPRLPAPAGATSFTGIAPPARDPSRGFPQPLHPDQAYDPCPPRTTR
jgi:hypothetical protein